ncbi:DUF1003 domain-containing protein [Mucilaginibacter sp.]|uniref:DUF1003 domain-containing protein n=1 Tax=Mucilaginibacter sp. TaxID=1882438 RepID=UPI003D0B4E5B
MAQQNQWQRVNQKEEEDKNKEIKSALDINKTLIDHLAIGITEFLGSMKFLIACILLFTVWICWNLNFLNGLKPFDPFPFPVLEMVVSLFAVVLSVSVLINQNRQGKIEKVRQRVEFEVNVRAENEITKVLQMLHDIQQEMGMNHKHDHELEAMKEQIDIKQLHQTFDEQEGKKDS